MEAGDPAFLWRTPPRELAIAEHTKQAGSLFEREGRWSSTIHDPLLMVMAAPGAGGGQGQEFPHQAWLCLFNEFVLGYFYLYVLRGSSTTTLTRNGHKELASTGVPTIPGVAPYNGSFFACNGTVIGWKVPELIIQLAIWRCHHGHEDAPGTILLYPADSLACKVKNHSLFWFSKIHT
jgi:hypothetical protein